ncbi:MAG: CHAP domain-containing protein, partial [Candidatus Saccharimonadales bacterium]
RAQLSADQAEQNSLLAYTAGQQAEYDSQVKKASAKIIDLRRQQALENVRRFGGSGGVIGGGGYPWGNARCLATGQIGGWCPGYEWGYNGDWHNWNTGGYAYRNCTDWVTYRVRAAGGYAPGGLGNANQWDDRAPSYGFTVSSTPKVGAAAVSNSGYYGHVMYVEAVNDNGSIVVSDYNRAGTGKYDMNNINPAGLRFVYF